MSRTRKKNPQWVCPEGRGCIWCGQPARKGLDRKLGQIVAKETEEEASGLDAHMWWDDADDAWSEVAP
jgi:hypothetical protein